MESSPLPDSDAQLVEAALSGNEEAAVAIRSPATTRKLEQILIKRGASPTEARDIIADLWADCFDTHKGRKPLLQRFQGKGKLDAFLTRTAINRLIDHKRRLRFRSELPGSQRDDGGAQPGDAFDQLPGDSPDAPGEDALVDLLRRALVTTFSKCDPEELLILRLVGKYGVGQERVAAMCGWSQSKVSRTLAAVMKRIQTETLEEVSRIDPWLDLEWGDFVKLCQSSSDFYRWEEEENDNLPA